MEKTIGKEVIAVDTHTNRQEMEQIETEDGDKKAKEDNIKEIEDDFVIVNPDDQNSECEIFMNSMKLTSI